MSTEETSSFIHEPTIAATLAEHQVADPVRVREILARAKELHGLPPEDVPPLMALTDPELLGELYATARYVKEEIYGNRLVIFAPLYVSNLCANECLYCAFRAQNKEIARRALTQEEIAEEVRFLITSGHKRVLLVAGESYPKEGLRYVLRAIETVYATKVEHGEVRRVNVNVAPLSVDEFKLLKEAHIGTYQIFQETYHRDTYHAVHLRGKKADYDWRVTAIDRAMQAGIDDCGVGVLFGLADWRFEVLALLQHIHHLEERFGVGPHTISVPRIEPATGSLMASHPPTPVEDEDFKKIVAILRMTVPYTGLIMSTRESAEMRRATFELGVSQISAGSRTNPGGYAESGGEASGQFSLGDHRGLDEVVKDIAGLGYVPSFCTACYRLGRTGADFMDLARPGDIKTHCGPNALATFQEYLDDYGAEDTKEAGERTIAQAIADLATQDPKLAGRAERMVRAVKSGKRDVFC